MYDLFIDEIANNIIINLDKMDEEHKDVIIYRLQAFLKTKEQSLAIKKKIIQVAFYYTKGENYDKAIDFSLLKEKLIKEKGKRDSLLALASLLVNEKIENDNLGVEDWAFAAFFTSFLNIPMEKEFAFTFLQDDTISLLCGKVKDDYERAFYIEEYYQRKNSLKALLSKPLSDIRKSTRFEKELTQEIIEDVGGTYGNMRI